MQDGHKRQREELQGASGAVKAEGIIGGNGQRRPMDFYPTPPEVTNAFLNFMEDNIGPDFWRGKRVWEPAAGNGAMAEKLRERGAIVIETDILTGTDFLKAKTPEADFICTNPPFSQAEKFIRRALETGLPFALLLKSQFWHSKKRFDLFNANKPALMLPLTWRPDFTGGGNSLMDCVWCVWFRGSIWQTVYMPIKKE